MRDMTLNVANPFEYLTFSQDCYLHTFKYDFNFIYFRIIWSHISLLLFITIFLTTYVIFKKFSGV